MWLKQRAYSLSLWWLLGHCIMNLLFIFNTGLNSYHLSHRNSSIPNLLSRWHDNSIFHLTSENWLPFMVLLASSSMLIVSLYRHHRKMNVHIADRRDAWAQAHNTALKSLGCFLILHLVYVIASPCSLTSKHSPAALTRVLISDTLMAAHPSLHSVILIMGIPRVKQTCQRTLWRTVCAWRSRGP